MTTYWMTLSVLASYPGPLTQAFVACSTNTGEGLVKLNHVQWCTWTCAGVAHYSYKAAFWTQEMSPRLSDGKCSVVLWSAFV